MSRYSARLPSVFALLACLPLVILLCSLASCRAPMLPQGLGAQSASASASASMQTSVAHPRARAMHPRGGSHSIRIEARRTSLGRQWRSWRGSSRWRLRPTAPRPSSSSMPWCVRRGPSTLPSPAATSSALLRHASTGRDSKKGLRGCLIVLKAFAKVFGDFGDFNNPPKCGKPGAGYQGATSPSVPPEQRREKPTEKVGPG